MFNKKLKEENKELREIIKKQNEILDLPLPKGCKKGDYCKTCCFSIKKSVFDSGYLWHEVYICGKDKCKEFVKKE